jgi:hypothetical protein
MSVGELGRTTPSELLAAADGRALALIHARLLDDAGSAPREMVVKTTYELDGHWYEVSRIEFDSESGSMTTPILLSISPRRPHSIDALQ